MMTRDWAKAQLGDVAAAVKARDVESGVVDYRHEMPPYLRVIVIRRVSTSRSLVRDFYVWFTDDGQMVTSSEWPHRETKRGTVKPVPCAGIAAIKRIIAEKRVALREEAAKRLAAKRAKEATTDVINKRAATLARRHRFQYVVEHGATRSTLVVNLDDLNEAHIAIPHKDPAVALKSVPALVQILRDLWAHRARVVVKCRPAVRVSHYSTDRRGPRKWLGVKPKVKP